jgi:two-component system phosphate regulon sensor histidine kinase PhoR
MEQQAFRLGAIIDDLLTLSRLEQNETGTIPMERTRVGDLFDEVRTLCADKAESRRTDLVFSCPENLECVINPGLMEQAITNLVQNAIKYSPEGSEVTIQAWVEPKESGEKDLVFKVTDTVPVSGSPTCRGYSSDSTASTRAGAASREARDSASRSCATSRSCTEEPSP